MSERRRRFWPLRVSAPATILIVVALMSFWYGSYLVQTADRMPAYSDADAAMSLRALQLPGDNREAFTEAWFKNIDALRTPKWRIHDRGMALVIVSVCLLVATLSLRLWRDGAFQSLATAGPWGVAGIGLLAYLSFPFTTILFLQDELDREMLPPWGDSVGLPLVGVMIATVLFSPIAITGIWFLARATARQKTSLWVWDREASFNSVLLTALVISLLAGLFYLMGSEIVEGSGYFIPMLLCFAYLILVARALFVESSLRNRSVER